MRSSRRSLSFAAGILAVALAIASCGASKSSGDGGAPGNVDKNAALTVGWAEEVDTLNPATTGARDVGPIDTNIFDTLVWLTPDFKVTPDLATKWSTSADGMTYTFDLRHDVTFHDGTAFDAQAVAANFKYISDKSTQSNIALGLLGPCTTATASSQYTVQVHCTAPYAPLLGQLGEPYLGMQSPAAIAKYGKDLGQHPTGTGPFSFVSYTVAQSVVLQRNDKYTWGPAAVNHKGPADISKITFHIVPTAQSRVSEFQSGQSQIMQEVPGVFWKSLGKTGKYTSLPVPISGMGIFAPINAGSFPTNDLAVRKAILYAVDKKGVEQLADAGAYQPANTPLQKGMFGYDASLENSYPYDPVKAEATLSAAGWTKVNGVWQKGGRPLKITMNVIASSLTGPVAQAIQNYLQKIGMHAVIANNAVPAWLAANIKGTESIAPLEYIAVDPDALHLWFLPGQYYNWSHYTNPTLTSLILQGQRETDSAKRLTIYAQAQKIIMDEALEMPIHENVDLLMASKKLTGVTYSGGGFETFYAASLR